MNTKTAAAHTDMQTDRKRRRENIHTVAPLLLLSDKRRKRIEKVSATHSIRREQQEAQRVTMDVSRGTETSIERRRRRTERSRKREKEMMMIMSPKETKK
jgi:hypothetical protein